MEKNYKNKTETERGGWFIMKKIAHCTKCKLKQWCQIQKNAFGNHKNNTFFKCKYFEKDGL